MLVNPRFKATCKIEIDVWENKELELIYLENRAFTVDGENMVDAHLDVISFDGEDVYMDDVDEVKWTFVETVYNGYSNNPRDKFVNAIEYMNR